MIIKELHICDYLPIKLKNSRRQVFNSKNLTSNPVAINNFNRKKTVEKIRNKNYYIINKYFSVIFLVRNDK